MGVLERGAHATRGEEQDPEEAHHLVNEKKSKPLKNENSSLRKKLVGISLATFVAILVWSLRGFSRPHIGSAMETTNENMEIKPKAPTSRPTKKPTNPPTLRPTHVPDPYEAYVDIENWERKKDGNQSWYQQKGTCYFDHVLLRVNNRPGHPLTCYSACSGLNLYLKKTDQAHQCVGWTLVRKNACSKANDQSGLGDGEGDGVADMDMDDSSDDAYSSDCVENKQGSNVCLLHHTFTNEGFVEDNSCWTGKLFQKDLRFPVDGEGEGVADSPLSDQVAGAIAADNSTFEVNHDEDFLEDFSVTCPKRAEIMKDKLLERPMRVFVGCLQASGCTLLSYLLAQRDRTTSILDLGVRQEVPSSAKFYERAESAFPRVDTIILKHAMRGNKAMNPQTWLHNVENAFQPDVKILFLQDPIDTFLHLASHIAPDYDGKLPSSEELAKCGATGKDQPSYGLTCGLPSEKLAALNELYVKREQLGLEVITYETICQSRQLLHSALHETGICIPVENLRSPKWSIVDVMRFSFKYFLSNLRKKGGTFWGVGNLRNTFTDKRGKNRAESYAYRMCRNVGTTKSRLKLLKRTVSPYKDWTLSQVIAHVYGSAPDIYEMYHPH